jgi:hypothetical protein
MFYFVPYYLKSPKLIPEIDGIFNVSKLSFKLIKAS